MARRRMIDPDFWLDEQVASLSPEARLLFIGLWGICDDNYATLPDRPEWIKVQIFPYDEVNVSNLLAEIEKIGKIQRFMFADKHYWYIKNFHKHQTINRPSKPKYPPYLIQTGKLIEGSLSTHSEVKEVKLKEKKEEPSMKVEKLQEEISEIAKGKKTP